jgi:hypothetical protein
MGPVYSGKKVYDRSIKEGFKMKKTLIIVLIVSLVLVAGCQSRDYGEYKDAVRQTSELERYEEHFRMDLKMDYDLEVIEDQEAVNRIGDMAEFSIELISKEDKGEGLVDSEAHVFYGGIGFDADYFVTEEGSYLSLPFIDKYIRIDSMEVEEFRPEDYGLFVSDESMKAFQKIWLDTITDDEVFKGEEILVDTPDGKVKTSKYTIEISDEIFKRFLGEIAQVLMTDDIFMENLANQDLPENFDMMKLLEYIDSTTLDTFVQEVYVDVDGYIVKETMKITTTAEDEFFKGFDMEIQSELYKINQNIDFNFPQIDDYQIMTFEELDNSEEWQDFSIGQ